MFLYPNINYLYYYLVYLYFIKNENHNEFINNEWIYIMNFFSTTCRVYKWCWPNIVFDEMYSELDSLGSVKKLTKRVSLTRKFVETKLQKYYIIPEKPICFCKGDPYLSTTPNCRVHCSFDLLSNRQKVYSTKCLLTKYRAPELHTEICQQIYFYIY